MSRGRPSLGSGLALAAVTVLACVLLGEIATRLRDPEASLWRYPNYIRLATEVDAEAPLQLRYDSELGHEPRPGVSLKGEKLSYSADGFRNNNLDRPDATGPLILALGDSYTEGYAVDDDETWPAHLERDTGRRVLNAGVRSYGLDQIVLRAERLAPRVKPRTMVLAFIESDIERTALSAREFRYKPYFVPAGHGQGQRLELRNVPVPTGRAAPPFDGVRAVLGYSHLLDEVMRRLGAVRLWYGDSTGTGMDADLISCRLMARFADLVRREGAKALVVAFQQADGWTNPSLGIAQRKRTSAVLGCAAKTGLATLDTYEGFVAAGAGHDIDAFFVDWHFNDRGHALAARLIAAALAADKE